MAEEYGTLVTWYEKADSPYPDRTNDREMTIGFDDGWLVIKADGTWRLDIVR